MNTHLKMRLEISKPFKNWYIPWTSRDDCHWHFFDLISNSGGEGEKHMARLLDPWWAPEKHLQEAYRAILNKKLVDFNFQIGTSDENKVPQNSISTLFNRFETSGPSWTDNRARSSYSWAEAQYFRFGPIFKFHEISISVLERIFPTVQVNESSILSSFEMIRWVILRHSGGYSPLLMASHRNF